MYSLLTPIRYVLNPRFHLTTPLQSGLLYIAPGAGYVIGCQIGSRWADYTVSSWIRKRGIRLPEDRLQSSLVFLGLMLPGSMVLYGWTLDKKFGGIPLPIICMFLHHAYDVDINKPAASHYLMRYMCAGLATAVCLPLIEAIGVGWVSTMSAGIQFICAGLVYLTVRLGERWRQTHQLPVPL